MLQKITFYIVSCIISLSLTNYALAAHSNRNVVYFDLVGGWGHINQTTKSNPTDNNGMAYGLETGYLFLDKIGVEGGIYNFPVLRTNSSKLVAEENISGQISLLANMPLSSFSSIFGKLGMGLSHTKFGSLAAGEIEHPGTDFYRITGFGAVGISLHMTISNGAIGTSVSVEGLAFTNNGDEMPSRYAAVGSVGINFPI